MRYTITCHQVLLVFMTLFLVSCAKQLRNSEETVIQALTNTPSEFRSYDEAMTLAQSALFILGEDTKSQTRRIISGACIAHPSTKGDGSRDTLFYAFNYADNAGFALINADSQGDPFICVTEKGSYIDGEPTGVDAFDAYINRIKEVLSREPGNLPDPEPYDPTGPEPEIYSYTVDWYNGTQVYPLLQTQWGKDGVYGAFCPNGAAGCIARAIGQVMVYYSHPGSITLSADMGNWTAGTQLSMPWYYISHHFCNHPYTRPCTNYHGYISALLYDISERLGMEYLPNGLSGASPYNIVPVLSQYGYQSSSFRNVTSSSISNIKASLDNNDPVIMGGQTSEGGHIWVADGYKDYLLYRNKYAQAYPQPGYYLVNSELVEEVHALHINWGWDGQCNGYFNFGTYNTTAAYSYDGIINSENYNFTSSLFYISDIRH